MADTDTTTIDTTPLNYKAACAAAELPVMRPLGEQQVFHDTLAYRHSIFDLGLLPRILITQKEDLSVIFQLCIERSRDIMVSGNGLLHLMSVVRDTFGDDPETAERYNLALIRLLAARRDELQFTFAPSVYPAESQLDRQVNWLGFLFIYHWWDTSETERNLLLAIWPELLDVVPSVHRWVDRNIMSSPAFDQRDGP